MASPEISVIIPVYNADRWLEGAMASVQAQTGADFEIIAVDDGSNDRSKTILDRLAARDSRVRVISRQNTGIIGALNDAIAAARGEYLARMDADDLCLPGRFAAQLARFRSQPDLVGLGSAVTFMDAAGHPVKPCPRPLEHDAIERALLSGDGGAMIHPAVMFRAAAVRAVGGYRLFLQQDAKCCEDLDLFLRLARVGTLANLAPSFLLYRVHGSSSNFTQHPARRAVKLAVLQDAHRARALPFSASQLPNDDPHRDPTWHAREWAVTSLAFGSRQVAIGHGWRAVRRRPLDAANWRALRYAMTAPLPSSLSRAA